MCIQLQEVIQFRFPETDPNIQGAVFAEVCVLVFEEF